MPEKSPRLFRIRLWLGVFIFGLVLSGVTAIPLISEVDALVTATHADTLTAGVQTASPVWAKWLMKVRDALHDVDARHPFLAYGTDWLAFGHIVIALVFIGAWREPIRNRWLFDFGLLACALVIPWALVFGALRGIPFWWRLIDCSFSVIGALPLWMARSEVNRWIAQNPKFQEENQQSHS